MPDGLPTSQMSDPKGSELAGYQGRNSQLAPDRRVTCPAAVLDNTLVMAEKFGSVTFR
jgi:hypothetical protein